MKKSYRELSLISENLSFLYEDGIEISLALELLEDLSISNEYKNSLKKIRENILKGSSLSEAFKRYKNIYPGLFIGLVSIGENTGDLGRTLKSLSRYYRSLEKIKKEIISALIYPIFLLCALILLTIFLIFVLIPNFYEVFSSAKANIPYSIEVIYSLKKLVTEHPMLSFLYLLCWGIIIPSILYLSNRKRIKSSSLIYNLKLVREVYEYIFILILSVIVDSGAALVTGIEFCLESWDIFFVKNELVKMNKELLSGKEISDFLKNNRYISNYTLAMVRLGEKSGSLSRVLNNLEERLEKRTNEKIDKLLKLIQPVMIISMAFGVGLFIFIFVIPMLDMMYSGVG